MLVIDNTLISEDIFDCHFCCDMAACKGICCVEGDAGAPLEEEEVAILEDIVDKIQPYLSKEGNSIIQKNGVFDYDVDGFLVTPLVNNAICAFGVQKEDRIECAIENAFLDKKINFQKPISCHLYPIRINKWNNYDTVDYHQWDICKQAIINGKQQNISVFDFLQEPLTRKYGKEWIEKVKVFLKMRQL
mgnify:CR=1 FL=1